MKKTLLLISVLLGLAVLYLLFWPVPIEPEAWTPPEAPALEGVYAVNDRLAAAERLGSGAGVGPEDVAVDAEGRIYGGYEDGRILRFQADGSDRNLLPRPAGGRSVWISTATET